MIYFTKELIYNVSGYPAVQVILGVVMFQKNVIDWNLKLTHGSTSHSYMNAMFRAVNPETGTLSYISCSVTSSYTVCFFCLCDFGVEMFHTVKIMLVNYGRPCNDDDWKCHCLNSHWEQMRSAGILCCRSRLKSSLCELSHFQPRPL